MNFSSDQGRLQSQLEALKQFNSRPDQPGITRVLFSDCELAARDYVKGLMQELNMRVSEDAIGNLMGTLPGSEPALPPVWSGSHIDTVLNAGMYDGMAGVAAALESCRLIAQAGAPHKRDITVIIFASEEPTRFGTGCIGSRAMAGHLSLEDTKNLVDDQGCSLYSELERLGYTKKDFAQVRKQPGDVFASVELHIEQAPVLEQLGLPIGVVEGICAPTYIQVTIEGEQKHAGSTPMNARRDPVAGAAQVILQLESLARAYGNTHTVATVGKVTVFPNASNVIAGKVSFSIDIRDVDGDVKRELTQRICGYIDTVAGLRGLKAAHAVTTDDCPHRSDPRVTAVVEESCRALDIPYHKMISGAYHDSLLLAEFAPMSMIFVPSRGGISHDPAEYTSIEDIARGTDVLCQTLWRLSNLDAL